MNNPSSAEMPSSRRNYAEPEEDEDIAQKKELWERTSMKLSNKLDRYVNRLLQDEVSDEEVGVDKYECGSVYSLSSDEVVMDELRNMQDETLLVSKRVDEHLQNVVHDAGKEGAGADAITDSNAPIAAPAIIRELMLARQESIRISAKLQLAMAKRTKSAVRVVPSDTSSDVDDSTSIRKQNANTDHDHTVNSIDTG